MECPAKFAGAVCKSTDGILTARQIYSRLHIPMVSLLGRGPFFSTFFTLTRLFSVVGIWEKKKRRKIINQRTTLT